GGAVGPVGDGGELLRADDQRALVTVGLELAVGDFQRVEEAGAGGGDVETGRVRGNAELMLHDAGRGRQRQVGRAGGHDEQVDVGGVHLGVSQRGGRSLDGEVGA